MERVKQSLIRRDRGFLAAAWQLAAMEAACNADAPLRRTLRSDSGKSSSESGAGPLKAGPSKRAVSKAARASGFADLGRPGRDAFGRGPQPATAWASGLNGIGSEDGAAEGAAASGVRSGLLTPASGSSVRRDFPSKNAPCSMAIV